MKRRLVDHGACGLNDHEQIAVCVGAVFGDGKQRIGLVEDIEQLRRRIEDLESAERRRRMPWFLRWLLPATGDDDATQSIGIRDCGAVAGGGEGRSASRHRVVEPR